MICITVCTSHLYVLSKAQPAFAENSRVLACSMASDPNFMKLSEQDASGIIHSCGNSCCLRGPFQNLFQYIMSSGHFKDFNWSAFTDRTGITVVEFVGQLDLSPSTSKASSLNTIDFNSVKSLFEIHKNYYDVIYVLRFIKEFDTFNCVQEFVVPYINDSNDKTKSPANVPLNFKGIDQLLTCLPMSGYVSCSLTGQNKKQVNYNTSPYIIAPSQNVTKFGNLITIGGRVAVERKEKHGKKQITSYYFMGGDYMKVH